MTSARRFSNCKSRYNLYAVRSYIRGQWNIRFTYFHVTCWETERSNTISQIVVEICIYCGTISVELGYSIELLNFFPEDLLLHMRPVSMHRVNNPFALKEAHFYVQKRDVPVIIYPMLTRASICLATRHKTSTRIPTATISFPYHLVAITCSCILYNWCVIRFC